MTGPRNDPLNETPEFVPPEPSHVTPVMPVAPKAARATSRSSRLINVVLGIAAAVAIAGTAFAAGRMTAPTTTAAAGGTGDGARRGYFGNGPFPGGGFGNGGNGGQGVPGGGQGGLGGLFRGAGGVIEGTIVSVDATSMTMRIGGANGAQGIEVKIPLETSTKVHQQASASASDLTAGAKVLVQLATATAGASPAPGASSAPGATAGPAAPGTAVRTIQVPAADVTIVTP